MAWKLLKDLIQFIPVGVPKDWKEIREIDPSKPVIILVSGFGALPSSLRIIRRRLIRDGFNVVLQSLSDENVTESIRGLRALAENLSRVINEIRKMDGVRDQKIFVVAHSAGGLVARYYIQKLDGVQKCNGLVTMATPHQGLWLASLGFMTHLIVRAKCLYDLLPVSSFIKTLNRTEFPRAFEMISIYSDQDLLCPIKLSQLPFNLYQSDRVNQIELSGISHMEFLYKKKAYLFLKKWLMEQLTLTSDSEANSIATVTNR